MKFIETIINKLVSILEDKFQKNDFLTVDSSLTEGELTDILQRMQTENTKLLRKSLLCDRVFKALCMGQTTLLILIVVLYNLFDKSRIPPSERNTYVLIVYIASISITHFTSSISLSLYSKTIRNLMNSNPDVLNRIFLEGIEGYEDVYGGGENPEDKDLVLMSKLKNICQNMDDNRKQLVYSLMKSVLVSKATKNFIIVSILSFTIIAIVDIAIIAAMVWKVHHLEQIFLNLNL